MLRVVVIAVGALLVGAGLVIMVWTVGGAGWPVLVMGILVLLGTLFERWRYRNVEDAAPVQGQRTGETFLDPTTGEPIEVYFDPRTGERRYVSNKEAPPPQ
jgi:hypothetical protein